MLDFFSTIYEYLIIRNNNSFRNFKIVYLKNQCINNQLRNFVSDGNLLFLYHQHSGFFNSLSYLADLSLAGCTLNLRFSVQSDWYLRVYFSLSYLWKVPHHVCFKLTIRLLTCVILSHKSAIHLHVVDYEILCTKNMVECQEIIFIKADIMRRSFLRGNKNKTKTVWYASLNE